MQPTEVFLALAELDRKNRAEKATGEQETEASFLRGLGAMNDANKQYGGLKQLTQKPAFQQELSGVLQNEDPQAQLQGIMQIGAKYGGFMGMDDQVKNYMSVLNNHLNRNAMTNVYGYDESGNLIPKANIPKGSIIEKPAKEKNTSLSPMLQKAKDTRTEDLISNIEQSNLTRSAIFDAIQASKNIQGGLYGKLSRGIMSKFDPNNPALQDWQKVKMVLTDAQLLSTAKTKGAISDQEMELFRKAAANDDVASISAMTPVFNKLIRLVNADETSKVNAFKNIHKENPYDWEGIKSNISEFNLDNTDNNQNSDIKAQYNALRSQGVNALDAKKQLGI